MTCFLRAIALWFLLGLSAIAQDVATIDYDAWESTALRAEDVVASARASTDALEVLRADIVEWRADFLAGQGANASRIETVRAQIAALGDVPEGEIEAPELKARRDALSEQLTQLRAPVIRAEEAFSRANGLITEIDAIIRNRQAQDLLALGPSPLNPTNWPAGWLVVTRWLDSSVNDTLAILASDTRKAAALGRLPAIGALTLIGLLLLFRARHWVAGLGRMAQRYVATGWGWLLSTFVSLVRVFLPLIGGSMLVSALSLSGLLVPQTSAMAESLLVLLAAGLWAGWIGQVLFPVEEGERPFLAIPPHRNSKARRIFWGMGLSFGLYDVLSSVTDQSGSGTVGNVVILYPVLVLAGYFCFRFGRLLTSITKPNDPAVGIATDPNYRDRVFAMGGRVLMALSLLGVAAGSLGYFVAAEATIGPLVSTIALLGVLLILNRVVAAIYLALTGQTEQAEDSLFPVMTGLVLILLALPMLALIWGARQADLTELWVTFLNGFSIGSTNISPSNFLTFIFVFIVGYTATRVLQGTLRNSVLPKTKLDVGGQTALISGIGYVGIFLAAILAITTAGIDLSGLAIVAGALSVGIGFGLQNVVSNFVSGIILLIERPVSEGDWIEVGGVMGTVRRISVRATRIETFDRTDVIVPNADLISSHVTNWTKTNLTGRLIVPVGVAYGTDTRKVQAILQEIAEAHPMVILTPPPQVVFSALGADSLDFEIRVILRNVNTIVAVKTDMLHAVVERFAAEGIEIPFAQRDVWLRNPEALRGAPLPKESANDPTPVSG